MAETDDIELLKLRLSRAEAAAGEAEERLRRALEASRMEHWEWDPVSDEVRRAGSLPELAGLTRHDGRHLAKDSYALLHPDDREPHVAMVEAARREGAGWATEVRFINPETGEVRWVEDRAVPASDPQSGAFRIIGFTWDITERKNAEAALRQREAELARVQRIGQVGGIDIDVADGLSSRRSPEYLRIHGLPEDLASESHADWLARVHPDDRRRAEETLFASLAPGAVAYENEYRIIRPSDGQVRWIHARADVERDAQGKALRLVGAHLDVTEQKQMQAAALESQVRLAAAFETVPVGIAVIDATGRAILANEGFRRFLPNGVIPSRDPRRGDRWRAWDASGRELAPQDFPGARGLRGETVLPGQDMLYTDDDREVWTKVSVVPTRDADGEVNGVIAVIHEIDADKRAGEALRQAEQRFRALVTAGTYSIYRMSPDWRLLYQLDSQTLADTAEPIENWVEKYIPSEDLPVVAAAIEKAIRTRSLFELEHRVWLANGHIGWVISRAVALLGHDGEITEWFGTGVDLTQRHQDIAALRESDERLRRVLDGMGEGFSLLAPDFTILEHNREALRLDGRAREQMVGCSYWDLHPGSEASELGGFLKKAMTERVAVALEHRRQEEGEPRWMEMRASPTSDGALAVFWRDVTDRRQALDDLRESEERYRGLFESMDEAYAVVEVLKDESGRWADFRFLEVNPAFAKHTTMPWPVGRTATELLGTPNPRWTELYGLALDTGQPIRVEEPEATLGLTFDLNIFALDRERNRVAVLFTNITERTKAEAALRESEERLGLAIEIGELASWDWDMRSGQVTWNDRHFLIQGYGVGEVTPSYEAWLARIHPDDRGETAALIEQARDEHGTYAHDFRVLHPDGEIVWCSARGRFFYGAEGEPYRMVGVMEDVTERRAWEERQKALIAELQHRTRNLMGVIRSMADNTARTSSDFADFRARYHDRLDAMARVQGLLSRLNDHDRVTFDELVETEITAMHDGRDRIALSGPRGVRLRSSTVQTLAMALHELATNAVKYGALGQPQGHLAVSWSFEAGRDGGEPWLHVDWRESGVKMENPGRASAYGHGRELIEQALPYQLQARTTYELAGDGVHCTISMPVSTTSEIRWDQGERADSPA